MVMQGDTFLSHEAASTVKRNDDANIPIITRREKEVLASTASVTRIERICSPNFQANNTLKVSRSLKRGMPAWHIRASCFQTIARNREIG
jgi:hypothetical protein